ATPFVVQQDARPWQRPVLRLADGVEREYPRVAGLSSFGAGGSNAHLIVEEYRADDTALPAAENPGAPVAIVLSARTEERLRAQAAQLLAHLDAHPDISLADLAYTLQVGREAQRARLAAVVKSVPQLREALAKYVDGDLSPAALRIGEARGEVRGAPALPPGFADQQAMQAAIAQWLERRDAGRLASVWTQGQPVAWSRLYDQEAARPRRLSLPTYPFARERYWLPFEPQPSRAAAPATPYLHPLVHRNSSDLGAQRYSTTLSGEESFLRDHRVQGRRVMPGVAQLEWARAAARLALGEAGATQAIRLEQVSWIRQLVVDGDTEVHITLAEGEDRAIAFEIHGLEGGRPVVYSQGRARRVNLAARQGGADARPDLDLDALQAACDRSLDVDQTYAGFAAAGLAYGPAFRGLRSLAVGDSLVLARVVCPPSGALAGFAWLPGVLDAALQASAALPAEAGRLALPFSVDAVQAWAEVPREGWAVVRRVGDAASPRLDVTISDAQGRVALALDGVRIRPVPVMTETPPAVPAASRAAAAIGGAASPVLAASAVSAVSATSAASAASALNAAASASLSAAAGAALVPVSAPVAPAAEGELTLAPVWEPATDAPARDGDDFPQRVVQLSSDMASAIARIPWLVWRESDTREQLVERLQGANSFEHLVWQASESGAQPAVMGLRLIQTLLSLGYGPRSLELTVITRQGQAVTPDEAVAPEQAGVHGLIGSLAKEYPHWRVRLLDLPAGKLLSMAELLAQPVIAGGDARVWRDGRWYLQRLLPCALQAPERPAWREGGVYVVVGGAGGIGVALGEYLVRRYRAQLVWLGRRAEDARITRECERLGALGPRPLYLQADAAERGALERAHAATLARFGVVHGVVHSAIVLADRSLANMEEADFEAALSAKAATAANLADTFGSGPLDFLLFFSSLQSFLKAPGQSNYAAGCCQADAFAAGLRTRPYPVKVMHWGYWGSVGVVASPVYRERMAQLGFGSIEPPEAMAVLERLLAGPVERAVFVKTTRPEVATMLGVRDGARLEVAAAAPAVALPAPVPVAPAVFPDRRGYHGLPVA
ncbi:SDR family oxidoreductase, partial [Burkholderia gladioli]